MIITIQIQLSPSAIALADKFRAAPQEFPRAVKRGMDKGLAITSGRIQEQRLTGHGPFPVALHRLGERTGQLKLRTRASEAKIVSEGTQSVVTGAIGSSSSYAAYQEFGTKSLPERAPFRTGIRENIAYISETIEKEVVASLNP